MEGHHVTVHTVAYVPGNFLAVVSSGGDAVAAGVACSSTPPEAHRALRIIVTSPGAKCRAGASVAPTGFPAPRAPPPGPAPSRRRCGRVPQVCSDHSINLLKEVKSRRGATHGYHCEVSCVACACTVLSCSLARPLALIGYPTRDHIGLMVPSEAFSAREGRGGVSVGTGGGMLLRRSRRRPSRERAQRNVCVHFLRRVPFLTRPCF